MSEVRIVVDIKQIEDKLKASEDIQVFQVGRVSAFREILETLKGEEK